MGKMGKRKSVSKSEGKRYLWFSVECEGTSDKSSSKVTSVHMGLQRITTGDEAQAALTWAWSLCGGQLGFLIALVHAV